MSHWLKYCVSWLNKLWLMQVIQLIQNVSDWGSFKRTWHLRFFFAMTRNSLLKVLASDSIPAVGCTGHCCCISATGSTNLDATKCFCVDSFAYWLLMWSTVNIKVLVQFTSVACAYTTLTNIRRRGAQHSGATMDSDQRFNPWNIGFKAQAGVESEMIVCPKFARALRSYFPTQLAGP